MTNLLPYQKDLVSLLLLSGALSFGDFTLKSGRKSPYFLNFGKLSSASYLGILGRCYSQLIETHETGRSLVVFGPSYKGIPLAVTTCMALEAGKQREVDYLFNRKEAKSRGEGGLFVGKLPSEDDTFIMVDDVITGGTTTREILTLFGSLHMPCPKSLYLAVDRSERGTSSLSATEELKKDFALNVYSILTIHQIIDAVSGGDYGAHYTSRQLLDECRRYLSDYGT